VIGDDGVANLVLGNGSAAGEAFLQIQQTALALRDRGVILAVSSKNDDAVARSAFRSHPEMLLKETHFAIFQANWQDKASNLRSIARTLNIGLDALVFVDDNPAERAQVRDAVPDVAVPELPADPALYPQVLLAAGYFESVAFTADDRQRADQYQSNAARAELLESATDLDSYLRSLRMRAICGPFDHIGRARISQLINKSNQFNLTTHRRTEADLKTLMSHPDYVGFSVRLRDRFGDHGLISIVIGRKNGDAVEVDTWLMSCRVLKRQVEEEVLNELARLATCRAATRLEGVYLPTAKNEMVRDFYTRMGFALTSESTTRREFTLMIENFRPVTTKIKIIRRAYESS
jgi:FkbH-like protein